MKKFFLLAGIASIVLLEIVFFMPQQIFAADGAATGQESATVDFAKTNATIGRHNGEITGTLYGTLNDAAKKLYESSVGESLNLEFIRITEATPSFDKTFWQKITAEGLEPCSLDEDKDGNNLKTFSCELNDGFEYGTYVFRIMTIQGSDRSKITVLTTGYLIDVTAPEFKEGLDASVGLKLAPEGKVEIYGNLNASAVAAATKEPHTFVVKYGKIRTVEQKLEDGKIRTIKVASLSNTATSDVYDKDAEQTDPFTFSADHKSYTASISGLDAGEYVLGIYSGGTAMVGWVSSFYEFTVDTPKTTTLQLVHPIEKDDTDLKNVSVKIRVLVTKTDVNTPGYIKLGRVDQSGGTYKGSCTLDDTLASEALVVNTPPGQSMYIAYTFKPPYSLTPGVYCIGAKAGEMEDFVKFTNKEDLFAIGGEVPDDLTIDPEANPNGCVAGEKGYCLLVPLPGVGDNDAIGHVDTATGIENYLNSIIRLIIGLIAVLSVVMLVVGGIQYLTTINMGEKMDAKHRITHALLGLAIALGSYAILNTINPKLVDVTVHIPGTTVAGLDEGGEGEEEIDIPGVTPPLPPPPEDVVVPAGDAVTLAKQILANKNIFLRDLIPPKNRPEPISGPKQNIKDTADGKGAALSSWARGGTYWGLRVPLSSKMLAGMLALGNANIGVITINAIAGGDHQNDPPSRHYAGLSFDVQSARTEIERTKKILGICQAAGAQELLGPCGDDYDKDGKTTICAATKFKTNLAHDKHIHCGWPRSDAAGTPSKSGEADKKSSAGSLADICKPIDGKTLKKPGCGMDNSAVATRCAKYAARVDEVVKDSPAMAKFIKALMLIESPSCTFSTSSAKEAHGLFQMKIPPAQAYAPSCGVAKNVVTANWLRNEGNIDKIICIVRTYIQRELINGPCGSDWRNVAAGYNGGPGRCNKSNDCPNETSCLGNNPVKQWECLWDDTTHSSSTINKGLQESRDYQKKVQYCMVDNPPSWIR